MTPPGAVGPPNRTFPLNGMTSPGAVEPPPKNFSSNVTAPSGTIGYSTMSFPSTRITFTIATEPQITDFSPSNGVGPPGQCNAISVDYHSAVCQQWKIDVLLALHENTPANQLNYISNFLSSLIRFCDKRSTMAFYYPDETDRCPSRCTVGLDYCKQLIMEISQGPVCVDPNEKNGEKVQEMFRKQAKCASQKNGTGAVAIFITTIPCEQMTTKVIRRTITEVGG
ncbi:unnamed protein product [Toxocara canis]|uniref:FZ domain-containing protein n=1 Tax=Toxocara canis TaxID=6265 RepID=A0A183VBE4_TOXCA|nr:unnamed protein product [Toxocara canis]